MNALLMQADDVLRAASVAPKAETTPFSRSLIRLVVLSVLCDLFYGAMMGTLGELSGERAFQVIFSALKVPLLLGATFAVSVPSFFVLNTLFGLRDDFVASLRALATTQAGVSLVLASLAPFTLLWYQSSSNYQSAILFNTLMFAIASLSGQRLLVALYRPLIERDARHRKLLVAWLVVFALVGIQMAWLLRPFIGEPNSAVTFFRGGQWSNAYETLGRMVWRAFG